MAASSLTWVRGTHIPSLGELILLEVDPNLYTSQTPLNISLTPSPAMFGIVMSANPAVGAWRLEFYPVGTLSQSASDLGTFAPSQEEKDLVAMLPLPIQDGLGILQPPTPVQFGRQLRFCRYPGASERSWVHVTPRPLVRDLDEETEFQRTEPRVVLPGGELMRVYRYADKLATNLSGIGLAEEVMDLDWNINHEDSDSDSDATATATVKAIGTLFEDRELEDRDFQSRRAAQCFWQLRENQLDYVESQSVITYDRHYIVDRINIALNVHRKQKQDGPEAVSN
ncbi:hypothetical protein DFH06DRAFT_1142316 [Mycena polygramma]|nr:hypothetical protein DFH06DRAFT_1142316 [Mycena polygramma]